MKALKIYFSREKIYLTMKYDFNSEILLNFQDVFSFLQYLNF